MELLFVNEQRKMLAEDILYRLPAEDIASCRRLNKDWRDLIKSALSNQEGDEDLDNKLKSNWDDKDLDDTDVKDSWEEEEDEPAPALKTEKKGNSFEAVKEAPLDPVEEKLRQQRLVGEADYKMGDEKTLDNFILKSESDFTEYAELVAHKLRPYEKSHHYIGLLKAVMGLWMVSLKGSDAKGVVLSITAIASEKIKLEQEANADKKKTEDEPVPSLLEKDNKRKSTWDDADLDDNEKKKTRFEALEEAPSDPDFASDEELIVRNEGDEDLDNKLKSNCDDEDLDDTDVKDSWEEKEDEPAPALKTEKKGNSFEAVKEAPLDPVEEKLRQQRLVGEADYKSTAELFGKMGDEKTLDNFIPKSESDFMEYAELVAHKLRPYEKSHHYIGLLKDVMRLLMVSLKGSDAEDVVWSITAIACEKVTVEAQANAEKKKKKKTEDEWEYDEELDGPMEIVEERLIDELTRKVKMEFWLAKQVWGIK
ncbi:hypothetical protein CASFOL_031738 [Castilleja foliolosa]|uniref:F-box domain-containing protein n=1 Tax=Castilleja foliolosa TaxID=1961234 RepID=A0ABD3C5J5_9LAMI